MATNLTETPTFPATVPTPDDGDVHNAGTYSQFTQKFADRTRRSKQLWDLATDLVATLATTKLVDGTPPTDTNVETIAGGTESATFKVTVGPATPALAAGDVILIIGTVRTAGFAADVELSLFETVGNAQVPGWMARVVGNNQLVTIFALHTITSTQATNGLDYRLKNNSAAAIELHKPYSLAAIPLRGPM